MSESSVRQQQVTRTPASTNTTASQFHIQLQLEVADRLVRVHVQCGSGEHLRGTHWHFLGLLLQRLSELRLKLLHLSIIILKLRGGSLSHNMRQIWFIERAMSREADQSHVRHYMRQI